MYNLKGLTVIIPFMCVSSQVCMFMRRQPYDIDHEDYAIVDKLYFQLLVCIAEYWIERDKIVIKKVQEISICLFIYFYFCY